MCCDWNNCNNDTVTVIREEIEERASAATQQNIGLVLPLLAVTFLGFGSLALVGRFYRQ